MNGGGEGQSETKWEGQQNRRERAKHGRENVQDNNHSAVSRSFLRMKAQSLVVVVGECSEGDGPKTSGGLESE